MALDRVIDFADRFWWLRGAICALTIASLVPQITDIEQYQFLRVAHAVIVGWTSITEIISGIIGSIPYLPEIPPVAVNGAIFALAISLPFWVSLENSVQPLFEALDRSRPSWLKNNVIRKALNVTLIIPPNLLTFKATLALISIFYPVFLVLALDKGINKPIPDLILFLIAIAMTLAFFTISLMRLPKFRSGVVFFITFVAALEILYQTNAPGFSQSLESFTCNVLDDCEVIDSATETAS